ncbi:MAG: hypothetical protein FJZ95_05135 [Chloroflexi bacterium]|nr:hypothetical protein [Chloroflexota bacterium]
MQISGETVKQRSPILVAILVVILPVFYWIYWYITTGKELKREKIGNPPDPSVVVAGWLILMPVYYFAVSVVAGFTLNPPLWTDLLIVLFLLVVTLPVLAFHAAYWRSIEIISEKWNDTTAAAFAFLLLPPLAAIAIPLAQIQLNKYAKSVQRYHGPRASSATMSAR